MSPHITISTLTDGGQTALDVATAIATFLDGAQRTLDLAQYDFDLKPATAAIVGGAIQRAAGRGVHVRLAYNVDHARPVPVPPPPSPDEALIAALPVEALPIAGVPDLMHHKYVIRDGEAVWTGSTNWTDDAWTRQENVIVVVTEAPALAAAYRRDFEQLAHSGRVEGTGSVEPEWHEGVRAWFTPGHGEDLSHRIAQAIGHARRRVRICSPVLTTPPVLGALTSAVAAGKVDVAGCIDATQMADVAQQWHANRGEWKLPLLHRIAGAFTAKRSTPYGQGDVHDFMHAKLTVVDDTLFTGSFNLSRSGERNAENVLEIEDPGLADQLAAYADGVRARYEPFVV
jgi:phosphatidylserine/phosphatidylglycerophosphate/cardiolipin synthase-like enzyme